MTICKPLNIVQAILEALLFTVITAKCPFRLDAGCGTNMTCYVGLPLAPYVIVEKGNAAHKSGFECANSDDFGVRGIVPELMKKIWKKHGGKCYIAPQTQCTFNELADMVETEFRGRLIGLGALLELPGKLNEDLQWVARGTTSSASIIDSFLAVVGRSTKDSSSEFTLLPRPFDHTVWYAVLTTYGLIFLASFLLKYSDPFRQRHPIAHSRARSSRRRAFWIEHMLDSVTKALDFIFDRLVAFGGVANMREDREGDGAPNQQNNAQQLQPQEVANQYVRVQQLEGDGPSPWRVGSHKLIRVMLASTIGFFLVVLLIFYQAALTNFLFQKDLRLSSAVTSLNDAELRNFSVLGKSGVRDAWLELQRENTRGFEAWSKCPNIDKCFDSILESEGKFLIVQADVAKYKIRRGNLCSKLALFETDEDLFRFNAGLLYGQEVPEELRRIIDASLLQDRVTGDLRRVTDEVSGEGDVVCPLDNKKITWRIYLIPTIVICFFVFLVIIIQIWLLLQQRYIVREELNNAIAGN